jgi:acetyl-CoA decarbonylase/synthase complex subunit gamma
MIDTPAGPVPIVPTRLSLGDRLGSWRMILGIGRSRYRVLPGLYAVGRPAPSDRVLVTANYKLSFDRLRRVLTGRNLWLLVLDTRGINVWCAAGKGTFSASEINARVRRTGLERVTSQRTLVVPQLGAPGVAAHDVRSGSGFTVVYGPVRAADLPRFLDNGLKADAAMRRVTFTLVERLRVVPYDLIYIMKYYLAYLALIVAATLILGGGWAGTLKLALPPLGAIVSGLVLVPLLLPFLPMRSFVWQGAAVGAAWALGVSLWLGAGPWQTAGNLLLLPALSAFCALNFTGSTTFTSQSGVNREIAHFSRPMGITALLGGLCMLLNLFTK